MQNKIIVIISKNRKKNMYSIDCFKLENVGFFIELWRKGKILDILEKNGWSLRNNITKDPPKKHISPFMCTRLRCLFYSHIRAYLNPPESLK